MCSGLAFTYLADAVHHARAHRAAKPLWVAFLADLCWVSEAPPADGFAVRVDPTGQIGLQHFSARAAAPAADATLH